MKMILLLILCFSIILIIVMINEMYNIFHLEVLQQDYVPLKCTSWKKSNFLYFLYNLEEDC